MKTLVVIDGYNFIFRYFKNSLIKKDDLEILREKLINDLIEYKNTRGYDIIVVFDSNKSLQENANFLKVQGIEIIYSGKNKTADSVIEEIAHLREGYDKKFIVTSDNIQQTVVFKENIYRKSVREFCIELNNQKKETRSALNNIKKIQNNLKFSSIEKKLNKKSKEEFLKIISNLNESKLKKNK